MGDENRRVLSTQVEAHLAALTQLWERKCRGGRIPARSDFSIEDFRPWLGHLLILDVIDNGSDFRYSLFGSVVARVFQFDLTGRKISECISNVGPLGLEEYRHVCKNGRPYLVSRFAHQVPGKNHFTITKLALPLSSDGVAVDKILAAIYTNYDAVAASHPS
ncbi:MAG: PAS domain-containing protein [Proteobacteria bacterium]|nr:PAS domain-containing protein [Pseudomonadota bacterium]